MQRTEHFQFAKPDTTDHYNIEVGTGLTKSYSNGVLTSSLA